MRATDKDHSTVNDCWVLRSTHQGGIRRQLFKPGDSNLHSCLTGTESRRGGRYCLYSTNFRRLVRRLTRSVAGLIQCRRAGNGVRSTVELAKRIAWSEAMDMTTIVVAFRSWRCDRQRDWDGTSSICRTP